MLPSLCSKGLFLYLWVTTGSVIIILTVQILMVALNLRETGCILGWVTDRWTQREANRAAAAAGREENNCWMIGVHLSWGAGCKRTKWTERQKMILISGRDSKMMVTGVWVVHNTDLMTKYWSVWKRISDYVKGISVAHLWACSAFDYLCTS